MALAAAHSDLPDAFVICNPTLVTAPDFAMHGFPICIGEAGARDSSDAALNPASLRQRISQEELREILFTCSMKMAGGKNKSWRLVVQLT